MLKHDQAARVTDLARCQVSQRTGDARVAHGVQKDRLLADGLAYRIAEFKEELEVGSEVTVSISLGS